MTDTEPVIAPAESSDDESEKSSPQSEKLETESRKPETPEKQATPTNSNRNSKNLEETKRNSEDLEDCNRNSHNLEDSNKDPKKPDDSKVNSTTENRDEESSKESSRKSSGASEVSEAEKRDRFENKSDTSRIIDVEIPIGVTPNGDANNNEEKKPRGLIRKASSAVINSPVVKYMALSEHPLPEKPSRWQKVRWYFLCPPHAQFGWLLTRVLGLLIGYGALFGLLGHEDESSETNLFILYVTARLAGFIVTKLKMPALLGMLLAGILLNNFTPVTSHIDPFWKEVLRDIAFITILIRAGLSLNPKGLVQLKGVVLRLAVCPGVLVEGPMVGFVAWLLMGLPLDWAIMLGFILAAVSPAVVVPSLLALQTKGYGVEQGVPTLIIAAASIDDIVAISAFSVSLSICFADSGTHHGLILEVLRAPLEVLIGIMAALVLGLLLWYIPPPSKNEVDKSGHALLKNENHTTARFLLLFGGGIMFMFGARKMDLSGAGALGTLAVAFITGIGWDLKTKMPVGEAFGHAWNSLMPLLFGLIGSEINIKIIDPSMIGWAVAVIGAGLVARVITTFCAVFGAGLNVKEQLFVAIAWIPKATVQAAMGSIPLDNARRKLEEAEHAAEDIREGLLKSARADVELGQKVITVAVLAILISAPLGAIAIKLTGEKLLQLPKRMSAGTRRTSEVTRSDGAPRPLQLSSDNLDDLHRGRAPAAEFVIGDESSPGNQRPEGYSNATDC